MSHRNLVIEATEAVKRLFKDETVSKAQVKNELQNLSAEIDSMVESLGGPNLIEHEEDEEIHEATFKGEDEETLEETRIGSITDFDRENNQG